MTVSFCLIVAPTSRCPLGRPPSHCEVSIDSSIAGAARTELDRLFRPERDCRRLGRWPVRRSCCRGIDQRGTCAASRVKSLQQFQIDGFVDQSAGRQIDGLIMRLKLRGVGWLGTADVGDCSLGDRSQGRRRTRGSGPQGERRHRFRVGTQDKEAMEWYRDSARDWRRRR